MLLVVVKQRPYISWQINRQNK